jgi:hypothetical protein
LSSKMNKRFWPNFHCNLRICDVIFINFQLWWWPNQAKNCRLMSRIF